MERRGARIIRLQNDFFGDAISLDHDGKYKKVIVEWKFSWEDKCIQLQNNL